jgi:hypothetical protein
MHTKSHNSIVLRKYSALLVIIHEQVAFEGEELETVSLLQNVIVSTDIYEINIMYLLRSVKSGNLVIKRTNKCSYIL